MREQNLAVRTPEGIEFSLRLAGPMSRFLAWAIDAAVVAALSQLLGGLVYVFSILGFDLVNALTILGYFVLSIFYGMALEWLWRGQTLGKRLLRLRVIDEQNLKLQFSQVVLRNLLRAVDSLPVLYLVGGTAMFLSHKSQRLGDFIGRTVVVEVPVYTEPDIDSIRRNKYNSLREQPHLEALLRQQISPEEAVLALEAVTRCESMETQDRLRLFAELAGHYRSRVVFPAETVYGLSDEQYVRDVVDTLFRKTE